MKLEIDQENNLAYLQVQDEIRDGEVDRTVAVNPLLNLDFDEQGVLLGIEFLDAKRALGKLWTDAS